MFGKAVFIVIALGGMSACGSNSGGGASTLSSQRTTGGSTPSPSPMPSGTVIYKGAGVGDTQADPPMFTTPVDGVYTITWAVGGGTGCSIYVGAESADGTLDLFATRSGLPPSGSGPSRLGAGQQYVVRPRPLGLASCPWQVTITAP